MSDDTAMLLFSGGNTRPELEIARRVTARSQRGDAGMDGRGAA